MQANTEVLKRIFPEFCEVDDVVVDFALECACDEIGSAWCERDVNKAKLFLAAHLLFMQGEPQRSINAASGKANINGQVVEVKDHDVSIEYSDAGANLASEQTSMSILTKRYLSNPYGIQYLRLLRRNFSGICTT